jgi:transcriptional regulator with XRE-family HTH domain
MNERELLKTFGANIKHYRGLFKWSQAELAEKVDISVNFLSDIETGKKWASPVTMVKFADAFNIEVYELFKPEKILPDKAGSIIQKYTSDVLEAISQIRDAYLKHLVL